MADNTAVGTAAQSQTDENGANAKGKTERRKIPGNFPYTSSPGVLRRVLEKLPSTEKPPFFTQDFLATVMQATGGSARPVISIFKATGLLSQSGVPTELYSQFRTESGRSAAALQALKNGFSEIFRRNQYAHRADEANLVDIIVSITGLPKSEGIVRYILNTFQVFQSFAKDAAEANPQPSETVTRDLPDDHDLQPIRQSIPKTVGLVYNLNIVLPETTNVEVYNAIFRSIKGNLLRD